MFQKSDSREKASKSAKLEKPVIVAEKSVSNAKTSERRVSIPIVDLDSSDESNDVIVIDQSNKASPVPDSQASNPRSSDSDVVESPNAETSLPNNHSNSPESSKDLPQSHGFKSPLLIVWDVMTGSECD